MMIIVATLVFAAALGAVGAVFAFTLIPALPRMAALLRGNGDPAPLGAPVLVLSDRPAAARPRPMVASATYRPQPCRAAA